MHDPNKTNEHTAYPETADIESSTDEYAARFAGPTGAWMLKVQEDLTLRLLRRSHVKTVLDVGGGHGQLAIPLCREGYQVTVVGSAPSCAHRLQSVLGPGPCTFRVANVIDLPFRDQSFDAVLCFRLITHCQRWPTLLKELCRVARDGVIADYPTSQSLNAVAPALFQAKKKYEANTRLWTLFRHEQIRAELALNGYHIVDREGQFFFPMVLHRMLKSRGLSAALEAGARGLRLHRSWGSPVIFRAERK